MTPREGERGAWWRYGVFYQICPRSFQDSNGDGLGDLAGILRRLDHLNDGTPRSLGVDAIWLTPFYPSPMKDFGYDVSDYCDVDPAFGTLADFDRLLAACRERGMRVIVDLVPNHTSDRHPWFVEARASRENPKRDWYVWGDPKPDGSPPNNWRSSFPAVGAAWSLDARSGQYYLHHFRPEQPDLNWWNPEVHRALEEVIRFWLDRGVDGFRIDVAHGLVKDRELRDNRRIDLGHRGLGYDWDRPEVHEIYRRWRRIVEEHGDRMNVGEVYLLDTRRVVRYYGRGDELHLAFNFWPLRQPWRAEAFRRAVEEFERLLPPEGWPTYTLSNHDNSRTASRYGREQARVAAMMLLTLRGTPFLYQGEEIAMTDVPIPRRRLVDVDDRDKERTPMQWDASPNAGFTTGEPWLPLARDFRRVNVAAERGDPGSTLSLYRRLMWFRKRSSALRWGRYRSLRSPEGVYAYLRESADERLLIALNFWSRARAVALGRLGAGARLEISTDAERESAAVDLERLVLRPNEGALVSVA